MEQFFSCKNLKAVLCESRGFLQGPHIASFQIDMPHTLQVKITQLGFRTIEIESPIDISVDVLYSAFSRIERLLMMFDGRFIPLQTLEFSNSDVTSMELLNTCAEHCMNNRLPYFDSADFCKYDINKLLYYDEVITKELYIKWVDLLSDLDIVHQVYLYSLCGREQPKDIKCAFLIELAEPLVETLKTYKGLFPTLMPGKRGTTLKNCLNALITEYGSIIFKRELSENFDSFLQVLVNSRVRLMHIKRNQSGLYFDGKESVLFAIKISLLYRHIIFTLLDIDSSKYQEQLEKCTNSWNQWNDILENFMLKLR